MKKNDLPTIYWDSRNECTLEALALAFAGGTALPPFSDKSTAAHALRRAYHEEFALLNEAANPTHAQMSERERDLSLKAAPRTYGLDGNGAPATSSSRYVTQDEARRYAQSRKRYNVGRPPAACLLDEAAADGNEPEIADGETGLVLIAALAVCLVETDREAYTTSAGKLKIAPLADTIGDLLNKLELKVTGLGDTRRKEKLGAAIAKLYKLVPPASRKKLPFTEAG